MEQPASFGYWLRRRRKMLDLTQDALAQQAGCAVATIRKIEADERRPSRDLAAHLANCLLLPSNERAEFLRAARSELAADRLAAPLDVSMGTAGEPAPRARQPQTPHNYMLREQIGSGSFSVVYRAVQPEVGREVAIKIILPRYANQVAFIRRFEAEAQIVARLEHPHIVPLYDYWRYSDGAYLVMRYMHGGSLLSALGKAPWRLGQVTLLLGQVGVALAFAHRRGVIHGDIKAANILLDEDGNTYLADFSIAKDIFAIGGYEADQLAPPISSPTYLAPEQISNDQMTQQTDIYGLGLLLYELLAGKRPLEDLPEAERLRRWHIGAIPAIQESRPELPAVFNTIIQQAIAWDAADRYPDMLSLIKAWQQALEPGGDAYLWASASADQFALERDRHMPADLTTIENPYKGLRAFGEADVADFFGRAALIRHLLDRMDDPTPEARFLAIVGPSGSGKSSLMRAGLIPALRRGGLLGSEHWFVIEMLPGAQPLEELEAALLRVAVDPPPSLHDQIQAQPGGLAQAVQWVLPGDTHTELVLFVDQFEELFTLTPDEAVRKQFLASLYTAVSDPLSRLRVVVALRADFYDRPLAYPGFSQLMRQRTEVVVPLTPAELEQAIVGPSSRLGVIPALDLVATIIQEVGAQPGALPLLQYALTELFEHRDGWMLTLESYRASGGVVGALARRAEAIYAGLTEGAQAAVRQVFLRLVAIGEGADDTRRRATRAELQDLCATNGDTTTGTHNPSHVLSPEAIDIAIEAYGHARLLTFDRNPISHNPTVEVAHEALLREWGRLRGWIEAKRAEIRLQRTLAAEAEQWISAGRDPSYLLGGTRLAQFADWAMQTDLLPTNEERAFLAASLACQAHTVAKEQNRQQHELRIAHQLAEAEQRRANEQSRAAARLRRRAFMLAGALILVITATFTVIVLAWTNAQLARQNAASAATAQTGFLESERLRLAAEANAALDRDSIGNLPALLSIQSLRRGYSPQADSTLLRALTRGFELLRMAGHIGPVTSVDISPDGKLALTTGADRTARLWDLSSGREIRRLSGHASSVNSVVFSPDGKLALTSSADRTARLWDIETGRELRRLSGHTGVVNDAAWSPDGAFVLTGSFDNTARLWNAANGYELLCFTGHTGSITGVSFSPDGRLALSSSFDGTARLWDIRTGRQLKLITAVTGGLTGVAFSPDGKLALTGGLDDTARLWNIATGEQLRVFSGHGDALIGRPRFSADGRLVLTSSADKTARLWDVATGRELRRFTGHTDIVTDAAISADQWYVLSSSADSTALLWSNRAEQEPRIFAVPTNSVVSIALSPTDSRQALIAGTGSAIQIWDVSAGGQVGSIPSTTGTTSLAFAPDGQRILFCAAGDVVIWNVATGQLVRQIKSDAPLQQAIFSSDGQRVLAAERNIVRQWDIDTGQALAEFTGHTDAVTSLATSPNNRLLLSGSRDGTARLWDIPTQEELHRLVGHGGPVTDVAFAPGGQFALTGSLDGTARLWDATSGEELRVFRGHVDGVTSVAYSPDGQYVLTGSSDHTARLWGAVTGQELRRFTGHTETVTDVVYAFDGHNVFTSSADKTIRRWRADIQEVIASLCASLPHDLAAEERVSYSIADQTPTCQHFNNSAK